MPDFKIASDFGLTGDQPQAVEKLVDGLNKDYKGQTLLGVTGSGKTFAMANIIERVQRPTLVISHNKTLAAQLYSEFKISFPRMPWRFCTAIRYYTLKPTSALAILYIERRIDI